MKKIVEKIMVLNPDFDEVKVSKAIELVGGNDTICVRHLNLILSLNPDEDALLLYLLCNFVLKENYPIDKISAVFGHHVGEMISYLNSVVSLPIGQNAEPEALRKLFLTLAKDFRVLLVLLVKKMEDLHHYKEAGNPLLKEACRVAMDIYIPIATRLGIYEIKTMMESVCFEVLYPIEYMRVMEELEPYKHISEIYIETGVKLLKECIEPSQVPLVEIAGRMKNPYSIYKKMCKKQKNSVHDVFDIFAFRVVLKDQVLVDGTEDISNCYTVLGLLHGKWKPIARRFKDYIAVPKVNGYRSLHTTLLGLTPQVRDEPVEVQIRSEIMHKEAEFGIAAHWWYKEKGSQSESDDRIKAQLKWLSGLADLHQVLDDSDLEEGASHELFADNIFVMTPNGDVKDLPLGSTPVDFAYTVHTEVGNRCSQAKVNGVIVPLDYELKNGDIVQIITKSSASPNRYWLSFVKTHVAKYRIKNWFKYQDRESNLKVGRELINKELMKIGKPFLDPLLTHLAKFDGKSLTFKEREFVLESVGNGHFSLKQTIKKMFSEEDLALLQNSEIGSKLKVKDTVSPSSVKSKIVISGYSNIPFSLSSCCSPLFGAPIIGFVGRGKDVKIHDASCAEIEHLEKERLIDAQWVDSDGYYVTLEIRTDDSPMVSSLIWEKLKIFKTPVKELSTLRREDDKIIRRLHIKINNFSELQDIMERIEGIEGVIEMRKVS